MFMLLVFMHLRTMEVWTPTLKVHTVQSVTLRLTRGRTDYAVTRTWPVFMEWVVLMGLGLETLTDRQTSRLMTLKANMVTATTLSIRLTFTNVMIRVVSSSAGTAWTTLTIMWVITVIMWPFAMPSAYRNVNGMLNRSFSDAFIMDTWTARMRGTYIPVKHV